VPRAAGRRRTRARRAGTPGIPGHCTESPNAAGSGHRRATKPTGYRAIGYARNEAPLGYAEPVSEIVVDPTDDVLRVFDHESAPDRTIDFVE
jgi:hypothetical protein